MASIVAALRQINQFSLPSLQKEAIERLCRDLGHHWRNRELDPATTIALFMQQVIHGNAPCSEVRHLGGKNFSASAYCQARSRLPLRLLQTLLKKVIDAALPASRRREHQWHGHRTFHIDGSSFTMPDTAPLRAAFGTPSGQKPGCGFPVAHLLALFSASTGLLLEAWASPLYTADLAFASEAQERLRPGDILLGDQNFSGYSHLALLMQRQLHALFPLHSGRLVDFEKSRPHTKNGRKQVAGLPRSRWIKSLGHNDQLVEYFKPKARPRWMGKEQFDALPKSIIVRELRRTVRRRGRPPLVLSMVTTLLDPIKYPAADLLKLRVRRWDVETNLRHLKTTMKMDELHCKSEAGVRKQVAVFCLVYNLVRLVMLEGAQRQSVPVARISFADALKWMRHARRGEQLPTLVMNPERSGRLEPRALKRRSNKYPKLTRPRATSVRKRRN
jgi:hypothetical protein